MQRWPWTENRGKVELETTSPPASCPRRSPKHALPDAFPAPLPERYRTLLFFGAPGSGKGTQGKALGAMPRFYHCACGDVFRSLDTRTKIGRSFLEYSSRGALVPSELTVELWKVQIQHNVEAHRFKPDLDYLVLDGIPRSVEQARLMKSYIDVKKGISPRVPESARNFSSGSRSAR